MKKISNQLRGYEFFTDTETGQEMAVQRSTGEITGAVVARIPEGSKVYTPESQEAYRKWKERETRKYFRRLQSDELGKFIFVLSDERFDGIAPETVTRLIYLNTFLWWNDNRLMLSQRTQMQRKDLSRVLMVSNATISRFWREVSPRYIVEAEGGLVFTNEYIFKRGRLQQTNEYSRYQKIYIKGIRKLYEATDKRNHRQLGYLFKLLPFINIEFNLLCFNPLETQLEKVELLSVSEFCTLIGFDVKHFNKLFAIYRDVCFNVDGRQERFCAITYDGINKSNAKICINPHILYSGSDYNRVEILGTFCRV